MSKVDYYRSVLGETDDWEAYLLLESRLPGPRANIELALAAAEEGEQAWFEQLLGYDASIAPANTPREFLALCGVLGLGKVLADGQPEVLSRLKACASDPRWRIREAVAMSLQRFGRSDMQSLLDEMQIWSQGGLLERRAAAAGLCEPTLLVESEAANQVLVILDHITASIIMESDRRSSDFLALRKGLGYCWSVAAVADLILGRKLMEKWFGCDDADVRWIMRQNLKKKRLWRADPGWTDYWLDNLDR